MHTLVQKIALVAIAAGLTDPATVSRAEEQSGPPSSHDLIDPTGKVCARGSVEQRLDCLGREIYILKQKAQPHVMPLRGLKAG
jgi:hypothetical protein